jgi:hypothetical protein
VDRLGSQAYPTGLQGSPLRWTISVMPKISQAVSVLALAALLVALGTMAASAAEFPKELWGTWEAPEYQGGKVAKFVRRKEGTHIIRRQEMTIIDEVLCKPLDVRKIEENAWIIKLDCKHSNGENWVTVSRYVKKGAEFYDYEISKR